LGIGEEREEEDEENILLFKDMIINRDKTRKNRDLAPVCISPAGKADTASEVKRMVKEKFFSPYHAQRYPMRCDISRHGCPYRVSLGTVDSTLPIAADSLRIMFVRGIFPIYEAAPA
jgi:hypothetical protein